MKFQMEALIDDLISISKTYQHKIIELTSGGDELEQQLNNILPNAMAEIDDPDMQGKSPKKYIENLFGNKLGNFSNRLILVCMHNDQCIGITIALPEKNDPKTYHIFTIGVNKEFRSKGIGEELLKSLALLLKKRKVERVILDVHEKNAKAIKFYRRLGFKFC